jgi:hypothetical protein
MNWVPGSRTSLLFATKFTLSVALRKSFAEVGRTNRRSSGFTSTGRALDSQVGRPGIAERVPELLQTRPGRSANIADDVCATVWRTTLTRPATSV